MGEELVSESQLPLEASLEIDKFASYTYTEQFEQHLPFFLAIGMTLEQFWEDDVFLCKYYQEAEEIRQDNLNQQLWLQGLYIYEALLDVAPVLRPMSKNAKPGEYPKEPYPRTEEEIQERKAKAEKEKYNKMKEKMQALYHADKARKEGDNG